MMSRAVALVLALGLLGMSQVGAQSSATVYHCGPQGRDLRDTPCSADPAASRASVTFDAPDRAQRDAAAERARQEAKTADALEAARLKREAEERRNAPGAAAIHGRGQPPAAAASASQAQGKPHPKPPKPAKAGKTPKPSKTLPPRKPGPAASA